jgi:predicted DNA-binding transcriptional regulator YafY
MQDPDGWAIRVRYEDKSGSVTDRMVSPIRFVGDEAFLALCLCREEPRRFELARCKAFRLVRAVDVLMPVAIVEIERRA